VRAGAAAAGAPDAIADARVELKPGNTSVFTGPGGAFSFRNLAPGRYTIFFSRDGFIPQEDRRRGLTASGLSITLAAGETLKDIVLPMVPAPVIIGKVFDPHGEPLAAALVSAYRRQYTPYGTQLKIARKGMTNDLGEFRLFGLNFGDYFVSAAYSDRDRAVAIGKTQLSANVSKADEGYATVFYDGGEDISRAQAAHVAPGFDVSPLNINLRDSARFTIRGQVVPLVGGTRIYMAPRGSDLAEAIYFIYPNASGAFEIRVPPGSYLLFAKTPDDALSSDVMVVNVSDNDVAGLRLSLQETISIYGRVVADRTLREELSGLHIKLVRSSTEFDQIIDARPAPDGAFVFEHVTSLAEYDVVVAPLPAGTYVRSISSGVRNILSGKARLTEAQPLQIALAAATDDLEVHVTQGGAPAIGIQVVLIPDGTLRRRADRYVIGFTGESGELRLTAVPPGRYTAYAFEQIEPDAYYAFAYDPAAEIRFRDRAVPATIGESGTKAIELRAIPAAETAGGLH
jgi:hypothetical protein